MRHSLPIFRLGLTGGIGSGKSTVANLLAARGAAVVDADAIARAVTAPNGSAMPAIAQTFGDTFVDEQGALNRERMRALAFSDPAAKKQLEAIVHPLVSQETQRQTEAAIHSGHRCVVYDVPLLVESGRWRQQVDRVLVVDCSRKTQIERVMARNGMAREMVESIIDAQLPSAVRLGAADWVIRNDDLSLDALRAEVNALPLDFN
jgi:dephospho-CoA kinase